MKNIKKLFILILVFTLAFQTTYVFADSIGCKTKAREVCRKTGRKKKDGTDEIRCYIDYDTKCTDKVVGTLYYTRDKKGNIYDMQGKKVGEQNNIQVNLDVNAIEKSKQQQGDQGIDYSKVNVDDIKIKTFEDAFSGSDEFKEAEYDKSTGYKTKKSLTYDDYKRNFADKGLTDIKMSDTKIDKTTGKIQANISGNVPKEKVDLKEYQNNEEGLKDYLGKIPDSLKKQMDYMKTDATVERELVMIPYAIEVTTSYTRSVEIIPPEPKNPEKPQGHIIIDDVVGCPNYLTWTEIDHDRMQSQETYHTDSEGNDYKYDKIDWIPHSYKYKIQFDTEVKITDAKGRNLKTNTLKSGYGYKINTNTTYKITGGGGRPHTLNLNINPPQKVYEQHDFDMTHIYKTQPKVNYLVSNGSFSYKTPINPLSKNKSDVIYTDRNMEDGKHKIYVELKNIEVAGRHLCTKNIEEITIKGDMYEDYTVN